MEQDGFMPVESLLKIKLRLSAALDRHLSCKSLNYRQVIAIFVPMLFDQLSNSVISFFNTAMISSSGEAEIAAVSMVDSINVIMLNIFIALATGGTVLVAQYTGAGKREQVFTAAANSISAMAVVSIAAGAVIAAFNQPILTFLFKSAEREVFVRAKIYLIGSALTYPLVALIDAVCGVLRGTGNTKSSLWLYLIRNGSYLIFNITFLRGFRMGITGLIISMFLSRALGMLCSFIYITAIHKRIALRIKDIARIDVNMQKRLVLVGIPIAAEQVFFNAGKLITQTFIVKLGTGAVAVNAICTSFLVLLEVGGLAFSLAIIPVVGQCVGSGDYNSARKYVRVFLILSSLSIGVTALIMLPLLSPLIGLFSPAAEIIPAIKLLCYASLVTVPLFWSISFVCPAALRAAGDTRFALLTALGSMWTLRVVMGYVLGVILPFGIYGIWAAMFIEWLFRGSIFLTRLRGKRWLSHRLVD
jgi:putative MATE family efflux protein